MTKADVLRVLEGHCASLAPKDEAEILTRVEAGGDASEFAVRTCSCGLRIEDFYHYLDHLKAVIDSEFKSDV